jgi:hypothetical protein
MESRSNSNVINLRSENLVELTRSKTLKNKFVAMAIAAGTLVAVSSAFAAHDEKAEKKAESAMVAACKKEYAAAVKGKSAKEVADWVETEERGANAETFKKSKCYTLHEKWEGVSEKHEEGEEAEHKN